MLLNCGVREDSWESLGLQGDPSSQSWKKSVLSIHWKEWCWSWSSNILATWGQELTHLTRPWCWERLRAGEEGDVRGWDGWMASPTRWIWVWASSGSCWWTGRPGVLQFIGHDWETELTDWAPKGRFEQLLIRGGKGGGGRWRDTEGVSQETIMQPSSRALLASRNTHDSVFKLFKMSAFFIPEKAHLRPR